MEKTGPAKEWDLGSISDKKALIIFDPDPFYNLDEKVCLSFARSLSKNKFTVKVATVAAAEKLNKSEYQMLIFCANTYNWRPDWAITNFIEDRTFRSDQNIVAVTLGAGSTESSQRHFENIIRKSGGSLLASYNLWLWRPNDETKLKERNVEVAESMASQWGSDLAIRVQ